MQIDFHHAVTYVVARLAGFSYQEAATVAHAAQYVDDATVSNELRFKSGGGYSWAASAHKMLDYKNFVELANARVWIPFHFFPGNDGQPAGSNPNGADFATALICRPNSPPVQDMVRRCIASHNAPNALHRFGIAMHVYVDTWAHQGFVGITHKLNMVHDLEDDDPNAEKWSSRVRNYFKDKLEKMTSHAIDHLPLGHGAALSHPDLPFLKWGYTNGLGKRIERNNPHDFMVAVDQMFARMVEFRVARGATTAPSGIRKRDRDQIKKNFADFTSREGDVRHAQWVASIRGGAFSFGKEIPAYVAKGPGSWKHAALGDDPTENHHYSNHFLNSDWKRFHDALQAHRLMVLNELLPAYGISVA